MLRPWVSNFDLKVGCERGSFGDVGSMEEVPVVLNHFDDFGVTWVGCAELDFTLECKLISKYLIFASLLDVLQLLLWGQNVEPSFCFIDLLNLFDFLYTRWEHHHEFGLGQVALARSRVTQNSFFIEVLRFPDKGNFFVVVTQQTSNRLDVVEGESFLEFEVGTLTQNWV